MTETLSASLLAPLSLRFLGVPAYSGRSDGTSTWIAGKKKLEDLLDLSQADRRIRGMRHQTGHLSDQIRLAVRESGLSRYAICKTSGVDQAVLSRFMSGKSGITTTTLDALARVLNLDIVVRGEKGREKGR